MKSQKAPVDLGEDLNGYLSVLDSMKVECKYQRLRADVGFKLAEEAVAYAKHVVADLAAVTVQRDALQAELKEINGCLDWGRIGDGASTLSEVQRTIGALRETQHALEQRRIAFDIERDALRQELNAVKKECERWKRNTEGSIAVMETVCGDAHTAVAALTAERDQLREELRQQT